MYLSSQNFFFCTASGDGMGARFRSLVAVTTLILAACGTAPVNPLHPSPELATTTSDKGTEVVLFAMSLIDTGYRFGGKNPEAGVDCSGMVSYVYEHAAGLRLSGSAAQIAKFGRPVANGEMQPGDLVFFNTRNFPRSHVGIYIGDGRFVHAPGSSGKVAINSLRSGYFADRFEEARRPLD
jgi:cell wall-associated NlpC family hydrolase